MRKSVVAVFALTLSLVLIGCSAGKQESVTIKTPEGDATVVTEKDQSKSVTMKSSDGNTVTAEVSEDGKTSTYSSSSGSQVTVSDDLDEKELGIKVYPGAKKAKGAGGFSATTAEGKLVSMAFVTPDDFDKVVAFFKNQFKNPKHASHVTDDKRSTVLTAVEPNRKWVVSISTQKEGGTQFEIMSQTEK